MKWAAASLLAALGVSIIAARDVAAAPPPTTTSTPTATVDAGSPDSEPAVVDVLASPGRDAGVAAAHEPVPASTTPRKPVELIRPLLPSIPKLFLLAGLCLLVSLALGAWRTRLLPEGLLPTAAVALQAISRTLALFFILAALAKTLPPSVWRSLPWVMVALGLAILWSARDLLPDLAAGAIIVLEKRIRRTQWIGGEGFSGYVERIGARATVVTDSAGSSILVPNRRLLTSMIRRDDERRPTVQTTVVVHQNEVSPQHIHRTLEDLTRLSPWLAPNPDVHVYRDSEDATKWLVRARVLEGKFRDSFTSALHERAQELFPPPPPQVVSYISMLPTPPPASSRPVPTDVDGSEDQ